MHKIRIIIADDDSTARTKLRNLLEAEEDIDVIAEACNGHQVVELARECKPDLIIMYIKMQLMSSMQAIEEIMCSKAIPILVVSSVADAHSALEAVGHGALEVIARPDSSSAATFIARVKMLAGVTVITRLRARNTEWKPVNQTASLHVFDNFGYSHVFAIACSTGGPQALARILSSLPADFPCPVLVAQHISDGFASGMADWLGSLCKLSVRLVIEGDKLQAGVVYISPSERHFSVTHARRAMLIERSTSDIYRPSCDVLLKSVADVFGQQAIGIILTGMGSDGSLGIARIREKGGTTLAQNEASSIIYGMNRVAIEQGLINLVLPLDDIADKMSQLALSRPNQAVSE